MSQENKNRDGEGDKEEDLKDPEDQNAGNKGQGDGDESGEDIDWEARAKKAEALIVKNKKEEKNDDGDDKDNKPKKDSADEEKYLTREEAILINKEGVDMEDLDVLKQIQRGGDFDSLKEAKESELFDAYESKKKEEKKGKEGSLGTSSGGRRKKGDFGGDMSDEEHEKKFNEKYRS